MTEIFFLKKKLGTRRNGIKVNNQNLVFVLASKMQKRQTALFPEFKNAQLGGNFKCP